jgi:hypothetical protein
VAASGLRILTFSGLALFFLISLKTALAEPTVKSLNISFDDLDVVNDSSEEGGESEARRINEASQPKQDVLAVKDNTRVAQQEVSSKVENESKLDSFFDRSLKILERIKKEGGKAIDNTLKIVLSEPETQKVKPKNIAEQFPDPIFYDAIYTKSDKFITYAYVYNNKTNRDNDYIPRLRNYDTMSELFSLSKDKSNIGRFYDLFNVTRDEKNFDINKKDKFGNTLLLTSLRNANIDLFRFLLLNNADPDICNNYEVCPMHLAVFSGNATVVKLLCDVNADIRITDKTGVDLMHYAVYNKQSQILGILLTRYSRYPVNIEERRELVSFAENLGRETEIRLLKETFYKK